MPARAFFDTNVLVYAFDRGDASRQDKASALLAAALRAGTAVFSLQVLQEFFVVATRKLRVPLAPATARSIVADLLRQPVIEPTAVHLLRAIDLSVAHTLPVNIVLFPIRMLNNTKHPS